MSKTVIEAKVRKLTLDISELDSFRWVLAMLTLRDIKLRYKQTFLGIAWVILQPLATASLFTLVFGRFLLLTSDGIPYPVFTLCGLIPWLVFSGSLQRASTSLINDASLITKVYFPRIFIPLSATFGLVVDFLITIGLFFVSLFLYHVPLSSQICFLPICVLILFAFSAGINFFFSAVNVYYRDLKHVMPFLIQFWMYASPLVYSTSIIPEFFQLVYFLNPMAGIIDIFRWSLLGLETFPIFSFTFACCTSFLLLVFGTIIFRKLEYNFADII